MMSTHNKNTTWNMRCAFEFSSCRKRNIDARNQWDGERARRQQSAESTSPSSFYMHNSFIWFCIEFYLYKSFISIYCTCFFSLLMRVSSSSSVYVCVFALILFITISYGKKRINHALGSCKDYFENHWIGKTFDVHCISHIPFEYPPLLCRMRDAQRLKYALNPVKMLALLLLFT